MSKQVKKQLTEQEKNAKMQLKAEKFKMMAKKRTAKAMQAIRLIANLASPNYVYTDEQAEKIVNALQKEVDTVFDAFRAKKGKKQIDFEL